MFVHAGNRISGLFVRRSSPCRMSAIDPYKGAVVTSMCGSRTRQSACDAGIEDPPSAIDCLKYTAASAQPSGVYHSILISKGHAFDVVEVFHHKNFKFFDDCL
jgi:hypothetical protein